MNIRTQSGLSLVEVLVTVLITSIGALGLASLQAASMKMTHDSYFRTQATFIAHDMADRMLANPDGDYIATESEISALTSLGKSCATSVQDASCSVAELTSHDLYHWAESAKVVLPDAKLSITAPTAGDTLKIITIKWNKQDENGVTQSLTYTAL